MYSFMGRVRTPVRSLPWLVSVENSKERILVTEDSILLGCDTVSLGE
jgi:hypothetical protein